MCLSTVYSTADPDQVIMEYVSKISISGDQITLTDIMGDERTVTGQLESVDLTGAVVKINPAIPA